MKALVANKFFYRNGGSEVVMFQEREFLGTQGHDIIDFSMRDDRNLDSLFASYFVEHRGYHAGGGLEKLRSGLSFIHSPEAVRKIGALIDETQPDLLHCHNICHQLTPSIIGAAKRRGIPVVMTLHDYKVVCPVYTQLRHGVPCTDCADGEFGYVLKHRCADGSLAKSALMYAEAVVQRWLGNYEKVDRFIAPSQFMMDAVAHRFPAERISLLYNGVDTEAIQSGGQDDEYVLYLGRLSHEKGVETLLRAYAVADGRWPLVVAGTGPLRDELMAKYTSVKFPGHLSGEALKQVVADAALVVAPSEWYENCPMSVLEAMAYGKPVVGSHMGGIPELIDEGVTGLLYEAGNVDELGNALNRLMADRELRQHMGRAARERVEQNFSLDRHNADLMAIYESVVSKQ